MAKVEKVLRLTDVEEGQVWYLADPRRIGKIRGRTTVEVINRRADPPTVEVKPAVIVAVTLSTKPIRDLITEDEALETAKLARDLKKAIKPGAPDETSWQEIWAERVVHPLEFIPKLRTYARNEKKNIIELYCEAETGRAERRMRTSPVIHKAIEGVVVPPENVPEGLFISREDVQVSGGDAQVAAPEPTPTEGEPVAEEVQVPGPNKASYHDLQMAAKAAGIKANQPREALEAALVEWATGTG